MRIVSSLLLLALSASAAEARHNLEARRLDLDKPSYAPTDPATLILTYVPSGDAVVMRDVRVDVEIRSNPALRAAYRIREVTSPQGEREFHMPLDLAKLGVREGSWTVTATIDGNDAFGETNEDDNQAWTTIVVSSRASNYPTTPSTPTNPSRPAGSQALLPRSQRVVAETTCSAFEREWTSPAEIGFHPGYGHATLVLDFDHPLTLLRSGERVRRSRLRLVGDAIGRPFAELGSLQATVRTRGSSGARCTSIPDAKLTQLDFDGDVEIDLSRAVRDAETLTSDCATSMQVILSFPQSRMEPVGGSLIRLANQGATLEVEAGR